MANPARSQESPSHPRLGGSLLPPAQGREPSSRPLHKTLAKTANLANLLPTGTMLGFQALIPSFSNNGSCHFANKCLSACLISGFAFACFISSFTDSVIGPNGKLYYGIATPKGLYVFNGMDWEEEETESSNNNGSNDLSKYRIRFIDFVHAFVSSLVFLVFAMGDIHVVKCFFGNSQAYWDVLVQTLPLGVGTLASFLFMIFPTTRRGIGYADTPAEA